jgi:hypothetical protein
VDLDVGVAGVVVDRDVEVVVAAGTEDPIPARFVGAPEHLPTSAWAHPTELLHVDVDELARPVPLVAHRYRRGTVKVIQTRQAVTAEHRVDGRTWVAELGSEAVRTHLQAPTSPEDPLDLVSWQRPRTAAGGRGPILEPCLPLVAEPTDPLVGGGP